jgi:hypothetical protein
MTPRTRLYASRCVQISFRTISGVRHRSTPMCIVCLIARRSNSTCHRKRNAFAISAAGYSPASVSVVTSTSDLTRNPRTATRTRTSRTVSSAGSAS